MVLISVALICLLLAGVSFGIAYGRCSGVNAWERTANIGAIIYDINTNGTSINDIYHQRNISII